MMSSTELQSHFLQLGLVPDEAAQLLSVSPRTVQRWGHGLQEIPGPAEQSLRAWLRLHERGLAWRPDGEAIATDDDAMIARHREHAIQLDELLKRVDARGGPAAPWQVDLERGRATLGPLQVSFYKLRNGGFSPQSYRRTDGPVDMQRDWPLIEEAFVCIAHKFSAQGHPLRPRLAFAGPSLDGGRLTLWENNLTPPVAAVIACAALREAFGLDAQVSDAKCRVLARSNIELLSELADELFARQRYTAKDFGIRVVELGVPELATVANRFSLSTLAIAATWGLP